MIQHISISPLTHEAITQAAREDGLAYDTKLALIVADWAIVYRGRQRARADFVQALEDACGAISGGD